MGCSSVLQTVNYLSNNTGRLQFVVLECSALVGLVAKPLVFGFKALLVVSLVKSARCLFWGYTAELLRCPACFSGIKWEKNGGHNGCLCPSEGWSRKAGCKARPHWAIPPIRDDPSLHTQREANHIFNSCREGLVHPQSPCTHRRQAEGWAVFQRPGGETERHCPMQAPLTPQVQQGMF